MSHATAQEIAENRQEEQLTGAALGQATETAQLDQAQRARPRTFIREMGSPGITPEKDASGLKQKLAPELSHHHVFGNITRDDFESLKIANQALAMQFKAEYPRQTGPSSKCVGRYRKEMFGEDKKTLTDDRAREADSVLGEEGVRSMMQSKSVDGMAFKGATQVKSVVATEGPTASDDGGGMLAGLKDALGFGGGD